MKRRDITLGEMQDECIRRSNEEKTCKGCDYSFVCPVTARNTMCPNLWNLTDPPRFTEAQMAFLKGCYEIGIVGIMRSGDGARTHLFTKFETIGVIKNAEIPLEIGETLDLAELLGKGD